MQEILDKSIFEIKWKAVLVWLVSVMLFKLILNRKHTLLLNVSEIDTGSAFVVEIKKTIDNLTTFWLPLLPKKMLCYCKNTAEGGTWCYSVWCSKINRLGIISNFDKVKQCANFAILYNKNYIALSKMQY